MSHTKNIMFVALIAFMSTVLYGMALGEAMQFSYSETPNTNDTDIYDKILGTGDTTGVSDLTGSMSVVSAMQHIGGFTTLYAFIIMFTGLIASIEFITIVRGIDS